VTVRDVLTAMIKAHEIQGVLALENSFNRVGLDTCSGPGGLDGRRHLAARRFAGADHQCGVECLGGRRSAANLSACAEYRFAQELAAGDATSRAVRHALSR